MATKDSIESAAKVLSMLVAVLAFAVGLYQFNETQKATTETRRIEATKPFLERQLALYTTATQSAATIATSRSTKALEEAQEKFRALYSGELALVEDRLVAQAMIDFRNALAKLEAPLETRDRSELESLSLALARACRDSLAESWGVDLWRSPYGKPSKSK